MYKRQALAQTEESMLKEIAAYGTEIIELTPEAIAEFREQVSVSYTHLDVYKRQVSRYRSWPGVFRTDIFIHRQLAYSLLGAGGSYVIGANMVPA